MVKFFLLSAVIIFIILCFPCMLSALEDNLASNNDNSSNDTSEAASPNRPSSRRIRPSAWSKDEKGDLKTKDGKNKEEGMLLLEDESSFWNMKNIFRYVVSLLYAANQSGDGSKNKSLGNLQIKMEDLENNYSLETSENNMNDERQNSTNNDTPEKSLEDVKMQNRSNNRSLNNRQLIKNSAIKTQSSKDRKIMDEPENSAKTQSQNFASTDTQNKSDLDGEMQNSAYNNTSNKSSNGEKVQKPSIADFTKHGEATRISKSKTQSSAENADKSENNKKTEPQSPENLTKSATDVYKVNFANNDTLDKSLDNGKIRKSSNNNSSESAQPIETSKNNQQSSTIKDHLNESTQNGNAQSPWSENIQQKSVSALINDKPKEEVPKIIFKDYEDSSTEKPNTGDSTSNNTSDEEVGEFEDDNEDEEEEDEDEKEDEGEGEETEDEDEDEETENEEKDDMDDNETGDCYINEAFNRNDTNDKDARDDNVNDNANDDGRKHGTSNKNPQTEVAVDRKTNDSFIMLPKFIVKPVQDQRSYSENQLSINQHDSNDNVAHEGVNSENIANKGNHLSDFQLSSNEFIDDYINTPQDKTPEKRNEQSSNADLFNPNENYDKSNIILMQIPISKNNSEKDNAFLYTTPSANQNVKDQNMTFNHPQNTVDNVLSEENAFPVPNENRIDSNPNKDTLNENFTENVKNAPTSSGKHITPWKLFPFQGNLHSDDLQNTFDVPQENYNALVEPATLDFQNTNPPDRTPQNDIPATNVNEPEVPLQTSSYKAIPIGREGYSNDPYENFNFQEEKSPSINNEKNTQFEQHQQNILQENAFPNIQHISEQGSLIIPDGRTHFTNDRRGEPVIIHNTENSIQNMDFQNTNPPDRIHQNDIPATNINGPEVPFQTSPYKPIPIRGEGYWNDPYENFNFQEEKSPSINNEKNSQSEQHQPTTLQQDAFPSIQQIAEEGSLIIPDGTTHFTNDRRETPVTIQNTENSIQNMEMNPNNFPFNALQPNPSFSEIYNKGSSPTGTENSVYTFMSADLLETTKSQNQINNERITKLQSQPDNSPFHDNFSQQQISFPETGIKKPFLQSEMYNERLPHRSNMSSEKFPSYGESKNTEFQQTQTNVNNSKDLPHRSFTDTESIQIKPKSQDSTPVLSENTEAKSPVKSNKPLIYERQKRINFNESVGQEQKASSLDSNSTYEDSSEDYDREYDEDESEYDEDVSEGYDEDASEEYANLSDETDTDENEVQNNLVSDNNYDSDGSGNDEDEDYYTDENDENYYSGELDEDYYLDENYGDENSDENDEDENSDENEEDDYAEEKNYDDEETISNRNAQNPKSIINTDRRAHGNSTTTSKPIKQVIPNKQNHTKPQMNNDDDLKSENSKSPSSTNEGNSSPGSESINGGFIDDYVMSPLEAKSERKNEPIKLPGTTNDVTQLINQKPPFNEGGDVIEPQETSNAQSKSVSSDQGEKFNTILEYIYKYSNNPLFKGVRDEKN